MEAYAKLVGKIGSKMSENKEFFVTDLPCALGRAMMPGVKAGCFIVLDQNDNLLSRQHAEIVWLQDKSAWALRCLSKNGCTVDRKKYDKDELAPLNNGSAIRLGNVRVYFMLPVEANDKKRKLDSIAGSDDDGADDDDNNDDTEEGGSAGGPRRRHPQPPQSYTSMVEAAFASGELGEYFVMSQKILI
jgi:hypothetical protein